MGIRRHTDAPFSLSSGHPAVVGILLLMVTFGATAAVAVACAGSDQQMSLQRELDAALTEKTDRAPAQCHPGIREGCYSGPEGTAGRGQCTSGKQLCSAEGSWGVCEGEILPATKELCNDIDDDCNGVVDDGFQRAGTQCWSGKGECKAKGMYRCGPDGTTSRCDAPVKKPSQEICDGKDNNCNGKIDDGYIQGTGDSCSTGRAGACNAGRRQCVAGQIKCVANHQSSIEICNKIDDDCDNQIDEECVSEEEAKKVRGVK
ncbi:MAG: MopE-related protein [Nannocystaceae bacterium]